MTPEILPSGVRDLEHGRDFYDSQEAGVGTYFLETVFSAIDSLRLYAGIHGVKFGFHQLFVPKFPYAIYYKVEGTRVVVYRILDCRSDPKKHRRALAR